jgi:hypothetical protein
MEVTITYQVRPQTYFAYDKDVLLDERDPLWVGRGKHNGRKSLKRYRNGFG